MHDPVQITVVLRALETSEVMEHYTTERDGGMVTMAAAILDKAKETYTPYPGVTLEVTVEDSVGQTRLHSSTQVTWV